MFSADAYVKAFIDGNWLTLSIFLLILRGIARQWGVDHLQKAYMILQNATSILRPGTSSNSLAKVEPPKPKADVKEMNGGG